MQAKKDQDWTDDAAFWDEAWADMNTRLDAEPARRKGGLAWLPFYLALAAFLLLFISVGVGVLSDQEEYEVVPPAELAGKEVVRSTPQATPADPSQKPSVSSAPVKESTRVAASSRPKETLINRRDGEPDITGPSQNDSRAAPRDASETTTGEVAPMVATKPEEEIGTGSFGLMPGEAPFEASNDGGEVWPTLRQERIVSTIASRPISSLLIDNGAELPEVATLRQRYPNALTLEAAYSGSAGLGQPGASFGFGYRIRGEGKLSFPLSLRLRFDDLEVRDATREESDLAAPTTGNPVTGNSEFFLVPRSIRANSLELGGGVAWRVAPRLRLTTGLSALYQLRASVNFEGRSTDSLGGNFASESSDTFYSLDLTRSANLLSALNSNGTSPDFNRWAFRAYLGAAYDITPRLGVNLKASRLLAQPDRADVIGVRTERMEIGLSYRLR